MELRSQSHTNNNNHHTVGMTKHQFVIFILKHLGIIDQHIHIDPWLSKFNELDGNQVGYLNAEVNPIIITTIMLCYLSHFSYCVVVMY